MIYSVICFRNSRWSCLLVYSAKRIVDIHKNTLQDERKNEIKKGTKNSINVSRITETASIRIKSLKRGYDCTSFTSDCYKQYFLHVSQLYPLIFLRKALFAIYLPICLHLVHLKISLIHFIGHSSSHLFHLPY